MKLLILFSFKILVTILLIQKGLLSKLKKNKEKETLKNSLKELAEITNNIDLSFYWIIALMSLKTENMRKQSASQMRQGIA